MENFSNIIECLYNTADQYIQFCEKLGVQVEDFEKKNNITILDFQNLDDEKEEEYQKLKNNWEKAVEGNKNIEQVKSLLDSFEDDLNDYIKKYLEKKCNFNENKDYTPDECFEKAKKENDPVISRFIYEKNFVNEHYEDLLLD
jgi:hypothetical protein